MNSLQQLVVVLPCHTLEDFPVRHDQTNAASLLANWTVLWHPSLIAQAGQMPEWVSSDFVTIEFNDALVLAPIGCVDNIPLEISDAVDASSAELVSGLTDRRSILEHKLVAKWIENAPDSDLVQDFFALGYAYLQIQLMTRQLRYSSSIDVTTFTQAVVAAATAADKGDSGEAKEQLQRCFDLIAQERSSYYPTDPSLIDLVLIADSTIGKGLNHQLDSQQPSNWLLSGDLLEQIERQNPDAFAGLNQRIRAGKVNVVGGSEMEVPSNLMPLEALTNQLQVGLRKFAAQGIEVETFASRSFNIGPHLPQLLTQVGFCSTIHAAFSGGEIPTDCAPVMNWQGNDGTNVSALAAIPLDAGGAPCFLGLSITIGEILDGHHHCPLLFVHWPGRASEYFDDLVRVLRYAPIFGQFVSIRTFNDSIYDNGFSEAYEADNYSFPWLKTLVEQGEANPISRFTESWKRHNQIQSCLNTLSTFAILEPNSDYRSELQELAQLQCGHEQSLIDNRTKDSVSDKLCQFFDAEKRFRLVETMVKDGLNGAVYNPTSSRHQLEIINSDGFSNVVEVSPFSFQPLNSDSASVSEDDPDVVTEDENSGLPMLRNEIVEIRFDPSTGGVRSVNRHEKKGNLFSQHLAIRKSTTVYQHGFSRQKFRYVSTQLEKMEIDDQRKSSATVSSSMIIVDESDGAQLARVRQQVKLQRRSRIIEFKVQIESICDFAGPVWNNCFASRLAFPDKELRWRRSDHEIRVPIRKEKMVAPQFVEIENPETSKVTLLPGGLPFHRKTGERRLDTLMVVAGESKREFEFGIAIDSPTSAAAAKAYLSPLAVLPPGTIYSKRTGWIFNSSCQNVVVTYLRPKYGPSGNVCGVIMRLIETEKRAGELKLHFPFNLTAATRTNFLGDKLNDLDFEGDRVTCNFCEHQYFQLECCW